jgi:DNA polymerase III gamma/tau subunit
MSLYNEYRPKEFSEVYGQDSAVKLLESILQQPFQKRPKVFLMAGPSGSGKTCLAYIYSRKMNCPPEGFDFRTLDASKDRSIDRIRAEVDLMGSSPMNKEAESRVWLIDECFCYNTPITCVTEDGKLFTEKIGSIVNKRLGYKVLSMSSDGRLEPKPITGWFENSKRPLKNFVFELDGKGMRKCIYKIACTDNHRLFLKDGTEIEAGKLKIGDSIRVVAGIKKVQGKRSFRGRKRFNLTREHEAFMAGTMLGDTPLTLNKTKDSRPRFSLRHTTKATDYFMEKVRIFGDMMRAYREEANRGWGDRVMAGSSASCEELRDIYNSTHVGGKVRITNWIKDRFDALSLAVLFCDDGSYGEAHYTNKEGDTSYFPGCVALHTHSFPHEDVYKLADLIRDKFEISMVAKQHKETDMLYLVAETSKDAYKLLETIAEYVPSCMQYKLGHHAVAGGGMSKIPPIKFMDFSYADKEIHTATLKEIMPEKSWQAMRGHLYDIEVADNHNYIANGVVAHNCHQLPITSQESLLKSCEEVPPKTTIFFATTLPEKLGSALKSRCKTITLNALSNKDMANNMLSVAKRAGIEVGIEDIKKLVLASEGNARVSMQLLENYSLNGHDVDAAIAMASGACSKLVADTYTLCRAIINRNSDWSMVKDFMSVYKGQHEAVRQAILGYLKSCILNSKTAKDRQRLTMLIECFVTPFYGNEEAGLVYQLATAWDIK